MTPGSADASLHRPKPFHPIEALPGAVAIPLLVPVIPIDIAAPGLVLTIMTVKGVPHHMGREVFPRFMW